MLVLHAGHASDVLPTLPGLRCSIMEVEVQSFTVKLTTASDALRDEDSRWERLYCAADECVVTASSTSR
jgi:hypothetical protein